MLGSRSWPAFIRWKAHLKHVGRWVSHLHGRIISPSHELPLTESLKRRLNVFLVGCKIEIGMCAHECLQSVLHCTALDHGSPMYDQVSEVRIFFLGASRAGVMNGIPFGCGGKACDDRSRQYPVMIRPDQLGILS